MTARILSDLGRLDDLESRIIIGAAVIDDMVGLIVLTVVGGAFAASPDGKFVLSIGSSFQVRATSVAIEDALTLQKRGDPKEQNAPLEATSFSQDRNPCLWQSGIIASKYGI